MHADCLVCAGHGIRKVWLKDFTPVERRRQRAFDAQRCAACGEALEAHQTWRHPHRINHPVWCDGFVVSVYSKEK